MHQNKKAHTVRTKLLFFLIKYSDLSLSLLNWDFQHHTASSPFLLPQITYSRDGENFLIYQWNSRWVIISFTFITYLTEKALILRREI